MNHNRATDGRFQGRETMPRIRGEHVYLTARERGLAGLACSCFIDDLQAKLDLETSPTQQAFLASRIRAFHRIGEKLWPSEHATRKKQS